jgi:hypothetical protein
LTADDAKQSLSSSSSCQQHIKPTSLTSFLSVFTIQEFLGCHTGLDIDEDEDEDAVLLARVRFLKRSCACWLEMMRMSKTALL